MVLDQEGAWLSLSLGLLDLLDLVSVLDFPMVIELVVSGWAAKDLSEGVG